MTHVSGDSACGDHALTVTTADLTDNRILECADAGPVDYIISGDRHLMDLKQHGAAPILRVTDFMARLDK